MIDAPYEGDRAAAPDSRVYLSDRDVDRLITAIRSIRLTPDVSPVIDQFDLDEHALNRIVKELHDGYLNYKARNGRKDNDFRIITSAEPETRDDAMQVSLTLRMCDRPDNPVVFDAVKMVSEWDDYRCAYRAFGIDESVPLVLFESPDQFNLTVYKKEDLPADLVEKVVRQREEDKNRKIFKTM